MTPSPNQRVGEYVLDEMIGQGAFGQVWRAHHHVWADQSAAVKLPTDPQYLRQLQREGIAIHRLVHPNIVQALGFDPFAQPPYLTMEYVPGTSLRPLIEGRKLTPDQAVAILRQILQALAHAGSKGVVHGDVKPENILIHESAVRGNFSAAGVVKVADFGVGLASALAAAEAAGSTTSIHSGPAAHTLAYLAPEQRDGITPDIRSDLYSCGVILYEMLTGERPIGSDLPSEINPDVPASLDAVFRRSYARREKRYASPEEFLDALGGERGGNGSAGSAKSAVPAAPRPVVSAGAAPTVARPVETAEGLEVIGFKDEPAVAPRLKELDTTIADEYDLVPGAGGGEAPPPEEPSSPPPAKPAVALAFAYDEMQRKPVADEAEMRNYFRHFYHCRDLTQEEAKSIRTRLTAWANTLPGHDIRDFGERIEVLRALACPFYKIVLTTEYQGGMDPIQKTTVLNNPDAPQQCTTGLDTEADYRTLVHLSRPRWEPEQFKQMGNVLLRSTVQEAVTEVLRAPRSDLIARQSLQVGRANVIYIRYGYEGGEYELCLVGSGFLVQAPKNPILRVRDELAKSAAKLLDAGEIQTGLNDLRRLFDAHHQSDKGLAMLNALRAKLSAAYMAVARDMLNSFMWLESLHYSGRAGILAPFSDESAVHAQAVRKRAMWLSVGSAVLIAGLLGMFAVLQWKEKSSYSLMAASAGALFAGLMSWQSLRLRQARTDAAFAHAITLPLVVGGLLAFAGWDLNDYTRMAIFGSVLLAVIFIDVMVFKTWSGVLLRSPFPEGIPPDSYQAIVRIDKIVQEDWAAIGPHYLELGPLYGYVGEVDMAADESALMAGIHEPLTDSSSSTIVSSPDVSVDTSVRPADAFGDQTQTKLVTAIGDMAAPYKSLGSTVAEFVRAARSKESVKIQAAAVRIEQRGKELVKKLEEIDRLRTTAGDPNDTDSLRTSDYGDSPMLLGESTELKLLKEVAHRAAGFRADQGTNLKFLHQNLPQIPAAIDRLREMPG